jgi:hypothetical protein
VLTHRHQQLGIESIQQGECFGQHPAVGGQVEAVDGVSQWFEDAAELPGHDR